MIQTGKEIDQSVAAFNADFDPKDLVDLSNQGILEEHAKNAAEVISKVKIVVLSHISKKNFFATFSLWRSKWKIGN